MRRNLALNFCWYALLSLATEFAAGQASSTSAPKAEKSAGTLEKKKLDACSLLTGAEVEAVQGERVEDIKSSMQSSGGLSLSQCLFHTSIFAKSVNLTLAVPDQSGHSALTPRELWRKQFQPGKPEKERRNRKKDLKGREAEPDKEMPPRRISGLGEEAFWTGNPVTGALYVLQGERFLRISIGGIGEESARIEKSTALARAAIKRL